VFDATFRRHAPPPESGVPLMRGRRAAARVLAVLLAWAAVTAGTSVEARLYRWTDENGVVHFSDRLPPEAVHKERKVYDEEGDPVKVIPAPKTAEQIEAEKRAAERRAAEERRRREEAERRAREERVLREMYGSLADIEAIRDERLELIDTAIDILEAREHKLRRRLREINRKLSALESEGREPSKALIQQFKVTTRALEDTRRELRQQRNERIATEQRFARDMERFAELVERRAPSRAQR
jgi:molecular chaperone DnaK (HSP70)